VHAFQYEAPDSLTEVISLLGRHGGKVRLLAGGTDLIDQMRVGRLRPELVVDIKKLPELNVLAMDATGMHIGAAVPCYRVQAAEEIQQHFPAIADSCNIIGGIQIQSRASLGGNVCNSGPAADSTPSLIALGAVCVIAGPQGTREVAVENFCTGPGKNVLQPGELLVEFRLPQPLPHSGSHYRRMIPRNEMDIAVVGVGASLQLDASGHVIQAARVALGAVAPTPLLATAVNELLANQPLNDQTLERAAQAARQVVAPITDMRGTKEYRIHVTGVLVRRVLQAAATRARGAPLDYRPGH